MRTLDKRSNELRLRLDVLVRAKNIHGGVAFLEVHDLK